VAEKEKEEWSPKTRDDWKGLFTESFSDALAGTLSSKEEKESKSGGGADGGGDDDSDASKRSNSKSFGERLLGI
jgi:hypothetical protein